jgi:hypothetical protein|tara:strand:+ start:606 stop:926 length:321 start_codon:yes stop_codon:yes gene_type:complete
MQILKFTRPLPHLILTGKKTSTWRVNDTRGIKKGDKISFCYNNGKEFAQVISTSVIEKQFKELTKKDLEGHEKYSSEQKKYAVFSKYYKYKVTPDSKVKIIKFKLL